MFAQWLIIVKQINFITVLIIDNYQSGLPLPLQRRGISPLQGVGVNRKATCTIAPTAYERASSSISKRSL